MTRRVLVVEDDPDIGRLVTLQLAELDCESRLIADGVTALAEAEAGRYDLVILDVMLPRMDGLQICRRLRASETHTPILMLTAKSSELDRVLGLELGADDYLTKPFDRRELIARIQAIVRRSKGHSDSVIKTGKLVVNLDTRTVEVSGAPLHLTGKEYGILELLSLRKGTTLTKEMFLNHLYGGMDEPELKIIDVFVCKLRKKLSTSTGGENYIETVWGRGYVLRDPEAAGQPVKAESA
jgi:two-component system cell cycle response regulator CtrA